MTKDELRGLWQAREYARQLYQAHAETSLSGMSSDRAFEFDLKYRRAMRLMNAAEDAYATAVKEFESCNSD